jgi:hypothetical protein
MDKTFKFVEDIYTLLDETDRFKIEHYSTACTYADNYL